jgi:thioredoxin-related protein
MDVDPNAGRRPDTIRHAWLATLHARRSDRVYLGLTAAAFVLGVIDSATSKTLETVAGMAMLHAAGTANGVAGRSARTEAVSNGSWQPQGLAGRLLGVLTVTLVFCAILMATAALVTRPADESVVREGITALSGVVWIVALVFLLSTVLPRRLDAVVALLVAFGGPQVYHLRTQFTNATAARAVEAIWDNIGNLVVFSDASPGATAWADAARWATNVTVAIAAGMLIAWLRSGRSTSESSAQRWRWLLPVAGTLALGARLLVPGVQDRVQWIDFASSNARIDTATRPVLYNFTAEWCAFCDRLERDLFAERADARWINERFVPVRVLDRKREDGDNSEAIEKLRERFQVGGFPTLIVVGPDGSERARLAGYSGNLTEVRRVLSQSLTASSRPR